MPYSSKAKFQHAERRRRFKPKRVRTVPLSGGRQLRLGFDGRGRSEVVSVLTPKHYEPKDTPVVRKARERFLKVMAEQRATHPTDYRDQTPYLEARARWFAAIRLQHRREAGSRGHAHTHSEPSHHVGSCDRACRFGTRVHPHRSR